MLASETYFSEAVNHASLKHGLVKTTYLPKMGEKAKEKEKTRQEIKLESYVRDERLFAGRVTVRMEELGLQAKDLSDACGISITAIQAILRGGTKYPRPDTLFDLSDKLGLEPRWLGTYKGQRLVAGTQSGVVLIRGQEGKKQRSKLKHRTER